MQIKSFWLLLAIGLTSCGQSPSGDTKDTTTGVSSQMSSVCSEYFSKTEKMMTEYPQLADNFKQDLDNLKSNWEKMTANEQENMNKICTAGLEQIKKLEQAS